MARHDALPPNLPPRGLNRAVAAAYIGVSIGTFDAMVADGRMPAAWRMGTRLVWDLRRLDAALDELPNSGDAPVTDAAAEGWDKSCQP